MEILELSDFSDQGIFFEDDFAKKFSAYDWEKFSGKPVRISNCGLTNVPGWVYLQVGIQIARYARKVLFGDKNNPKRIFKKETDNC